MILIGDSVPSKQSFDCLLGYIYYGNVAITPVEALYLYTASCFYGFSNNRLQVLCKQKLDTDISVDNVVAVLGASYDIGAIRIRQYLIDLIVSDHSSLCQLESTKALPKGLLLEMVHIGDLVPPRQSFDTLLRYIYYGDDAISPLEALYIYSAPCFYGLSNNLLQVLCKEKLETDINADNVVAVLKASYDIGARGVNRYLTALIATDYPSLCQSESVPKPDMDLLRDIIEPVADETECDSSLAEGALNADT